MLQVIGRPYFPPYWALGFHLSRFGYLDTEDMRGATERTLQNDIPLVGIAQSGTSCCRAPAFRSYRPMTSCGAQTRVVCFAGCSVRRHRPHGRVPELRAQRVQLRGPARVFQRAARPRDEGRHHPGEC